jgi:P4 family phage/plasmid primase-like protien
MSAVEEYFQFIKKYQIITEKNDNDDPCNFMSMGKPFGKYLIPPDALSKFYELYSRVAFTTDQKLYLVEKPGELSPVKIDVDLSFPLSGIKINDIKRRYTSKMVKELISVYRKEIEHFFDASALNKGYRVYVFEKPEPTIRDHDVKDGFHLLFTVVCDMKTQQLLRLRVLPHINDIFKLIKPINTPEHILDKAVCNRGNWMVYGSTKPNIPGYVLTKAYALKPGEADQFFKLKIEKFDNNKLPEQFKVSGFEKSTPYLNREKEEEILNWYNNDRSGMKKKERKELERIIDTLRMQNNKHIFHEKVIEPKERIEKLADALNPARAENYTEWMEVGWCLHSISQDYLDIWIKFSKKSKKYVRGECEKKWDKFEKREDGLTIGSLYYWVKNDNPILYQDLRENDIFSLAVKHMTGTHYDLACLMYAMFKDKFVFADFDSKLWYKFDGTKWVKSIDGYEIRQKMSTELVNLFNRIIAYFEKKSAELKGEEQRKACGAVTLFAQQISFKLKNETFKSRVMDSCKQKFFDPKFINKLDANQYLLGFENGVYDFQQKRFREGKPEDYVSMSTNINYIHFSKRHAMRKPVQKFLNQIMPIKGTRQYIKKLMSSFLCGYNAEQKFNIFIGCGSNGKSVLINLIRSIMGDYFAKIDVALITRKRKDANGASPELAKMKGKRLCVFDEPNANEPLNLGIMKILSGADAITARALFEPPTEFVPQCKLVLLTNHLPIILQGDNGVWRRISVLEFVSRFVDAPNTHRQYEFKIDRTLNDQLKSWREYFISYLIHVYVNKYVDNGLKEPEEVVKYTKRYEEKSDHYKRFVTETLKKVPDKKKIIKLNDLYSELKIWYRQSYPSNKDCPSKSDLTEYLMDTLDLDTYNPTRKVLYGFILREDDEDDEVEQVEPAN